MTSYLLASIAFGTATWRDRESWHWLAPAAFGLNAVRLCGRIASTFGGVTWLDALNDSAYYPFVLAVDGPLFAWFVLKSLAGEPGRIDSRHAESKTQAAHDRRDSHS